MSDTDNKPGNGTPAPAPMHIVAVVNEETLHQLLAATLKLLEIYAENTVATLKLAAELEEIRTHGPKVQP